MPCGRTVHPRARGEPVEPGALHARARFIPALAGTTAAPSPGPSVHPRARGDHPCPARDRARRRDHPRARGEHCHGTVRDEEGGPSPRSRGTPPRTTPGTFGPSPRSRGTPPAGGPLSRCPDHPRARGEHPWAPTSLARSRFIPALAGNTRTGRTRRSAVGSVHPRARGEHLFRAQRSVRADGSSPRSRGTLHLGEPRGIGRRFIPALAGNTLERIIDAPCKTVHPRARGEHRPQHQHTAGGRFIPALAGNTVRR